MTLLQRLLLQVFVFGTIGSVVGYYGGVKLPEDTIAELVQSIGNISAIAGSLLGWSVGWLTQSRGLVKEIDYNSARDLFRQLGDMQKELTWRWGIVFSSSVIGIIISVIMKMPNVTDDCFRAMIAIAAGFLCVSLGFIGYLFERMLALSVLKSQLDEYEHDELHKQHLSSGSEPKE